MTVLNLLKNFFLSDNDVAGNIRAEDDAFAIKYNCVVVEFAETLDSSSGEILAALLRSQKNLNVSYLTV